MMEEVDIREYGEIGKHIALKQQQLKALRVQVPLLLL